MPRLPRRPRLVGFHRRPVLGLGVALAVAGLLGALVHGPDDTLMLGEQVQPDASAGLPTVAHPVSTAFGGAELVVRAEASGGLFLGAGHRVDVTDLIDGIRHVEVDSLGVGEAVFVEGFPVELEPEPIVGWLERSSGDGVREVRVDLHGPPVDVLAVPVNPTSPVTISFGVRVAGLFVRALVILAAGLVLLGLWFAGRRVRRRGAGDDETRVGTGDDGPDDEPDDGAGTTPPPARSTGRAVVPPLADSRWRRPEPDAREPAASEPEAPKPPAPQPPAPEPDGRAAPAPRSATAATPVGAGVAVGAAALALGGWARWRAHRRRGGTTLLLLLALLLAGCGLAPEGDRSEAKPGLEEAAVQEALDDYAARWTRAARRANAPRFDGAGWVEVQDGPLLAGSQWQAIADRLERVRRRVPRAELTGAQVHAPLFRDYPMWAAVEVERAGAGRQLVVLTREAFAEPWLATAAVDVEWGVVPRPDPMPEPVDGEAFDAGAAVAELVGSWWENGAEDGLIVDEDTVALRDEIAPLYYPPAVQAWPGASERRFVVGVRGGDQMLVAVHRMTVGARPYALTSLVLMPSVGRPRVLASSVLRILR